MPEMVRDNNTYNLRNQLDYATVARRLEIYSKSVLPSSIKLWNDLNIETRNSDTLLSFKGKLRQQFNSPVVPKHYLEGERFLQIHHARIRNKCSNLNHDLFNNHLRDDQQSRC